MVKRSEAKRCRRGLLFGSYVHKVAERWHVAYELFLDIHT